MAKITALKSFDYTTSFFAEVPMPPQGLTSTFMSYVSADNLYRIEITGTGFKDNSGDGDFDTGWMTGISVITDGTPLYTAEIGKEVAVEFEEGTTYQVDEFVLQEMVAEYAYWLKENDQVIGSDENDRLAGFVGNDQISGNEGNDFLEGWSGNDTIDGGSGIDTAVFTALYSASTLSKIGDNQWQVTGPEGTDTLENIERLTFNDTSLALDFSGNAGKVAKILGAVFGASSVNNKDYVGIGLSLMDSGTYSYESLASYAIQTAGATSAQQVVDLLWANVVGGNPSSVQAQPFLDILNSGMSYGALTVLAADTELNQSKIGMTGLASQGLEFNYFPAF